MGLRSGPLLHLLLAEASDVAVKIDSPREKKPFVRREYVCYTCHKPGHRRSDCPLKKDGNNDLYQCTSLKRVRVDEVVHAERVRKGKRVPNVVYGTVNDVPTILVVDSGADTSVFNAALVKDDQYTGEMLETRAFDGKLACYPLATVLCTVGEWSFNLPCVAIEMGPEESGLIGFIDTEAMHNLLDFAALTELRADTHLNIRLTREEARKNAAEAERLAILEKLECPHPKDPDSFPDKEADNTVEEQVRPVVTACDVDVMVVGQDVDVIDAVEFGDRESVNADVVQDMECSSVCDEMVEAVKVDVSLIKWKEFADVGDKGFYWDRGILRKVSEDDLGEPKYLLVVSTLFIPRVLSAAHDRMGHQSLEKVMSLINRNFTWPSAYSETKLYIRAVCCVPT